MSLKLIDPESFYKRDFDEIVLQFTIYDSRFSKNKTTVKCSRSTVITL